jgi:hypothetical protein
VLVLLALDAHAWGVRFRADDLRFRVDPTSHALWRVSDLSPDGFDRGLLGVRDDVEYRQALQQFRIGRPLDQIGTPDVTAHRVDAQIQLTQFVSNHNDPARASQVDNLLGVLGFGLGAQDPRLRASFDNNAVTAFRNAVVADPSDDDAFYNLEYALDQARGEAEQQIAGNNELDQRGGAGLKQPGSGY